MTSSNSFSSSSTTSSLSSGTDIKDAQMCFDDSKLFQAQNSLESDCPILTVSEFSEKDDRYWERRRKNNAAAKRSRERRRQHDIAMEQQIQNLKLSNAYLRKEVFALKQKLSLHVSSLENSELTSPQITQNQNYFQIDDISTILSGDIAKLISPSYIRITNSDSISNSMSQLSTSNTERFFKTEICDYSNTSLDPLDLSLKMKNESVKFNMNNPLPKTHSRSNSETSNLDQRYWDRRRRNNEAVRKCRQNKRAKMLNNVNNINNNNNSVISNSNNNNNNNNGQINVDKVQIKTKIESITNELERLKSELKKSEVIPIEIPIKTEEIVSNFSQRIHFNEDCKKTMKWKNKLIEADQAEKEILNQIKV